MILRIVLSVTDTGLQRYLTDKLSAPDVIVDRVRPNKGAWERIIRRGSDIVIVSQSLIPVPLESSFYLLNELPEIPTTIVITPHDSAESHASLLASGCDTVLYAALPQRQIVDAIEATIENRRQLLKRNPIDIEIHNKPKLSDFISEGPIMQMFMQVVRRVVSNRTSLLILGETGVGKEHLAKAIHAEGPYSSGPFIAVNCAALPEQLLESELFGHEEGAFTGATRRRRGAFEMAHEGTLFLDEIGEIPLHLQAKLLRVLQDFEVRRVGGEQTLKVDVRVMAASNRDLEAESSAHRFRQDLFYRLSVIELMVPPLRERRQDIPALAKSIIARIAPKIGIDIYDISSSVLEQFCHYDWPGNVRELSNVLERALLLCEGDQITLADLPAGITGVSSQELSLLPIEDGQTQKWRDKTLPEVCGEALNQIERAYLTMVLTETGGRMGPTAQRAGIHPRGLYQKMKKHSLKKEAFRNRKTS
ncbi:sigma-54 interaction domain-containing protein [Planctomycetota bacterium]